MPIAFRKSRDERDWAGRRQELTLFGQKAYLVEAADLRADHRWSETSSIENIRQDLRFRSYADHLVDIVRDEGISLIHAFGAFHQRGLIAAFAGAKCGVPHMLSLRGVDLETRMFDAMVAPLQASILSTSLIVCVSDDARRLLEGVFRPSCPVRVIRNHFDPSLFDESIAELPELPDDPGSVIGCFGKFRRVMGLDFLIDAVAELAQRRKITLLLGGSIQKREAEYYEARIAESPACAHIVRIGSVPHRAMLGYLKRCSVAVYPSISDASPNKILEAMYARAPIVSTRVGGIPELVSDGKEALLVEARSSSALARAVEKLLDDPMFAQALTRAAFDRVTGEHAIDAERDLWVEVYLQALRLA
ncbi:glycosyltransferase [Ovoidimarina sediminis]|uniref:glycosyltransferase n=1 Tax=Ovoidimarina sediminis TaxID=3079856 RepID=UPI0029107E3F|nr:glycosyltransferase [Rhodophyticola sp. MJ-SS7]MDU8944707.1 glycosyltransferase [Rhodophyticola sp. MJ-SS7]